MIARVQALAAGCGGEFGCGDPLVWVLIAAVFLVGLWGVVVEDNLIKKIVGLSIVNSAIIMVFVYYGSLSGDTAPIRIVAGQSPVDPIPQALTLTAIVVGICVVAVALVLVYRLYLRFGTLDITEIERRVWTSGDHDRSEGSDSSEGPDRPESPEARE